LTKMGIAVMDDVSLMRRLRARQLRPNHVLRNQISGKRNCPIEEAVS